MLLKYIKRARDLARFELRMLQVYLFDYRRYRKHAAPNRRFSNDTQRGAFLLMVLHSIEKGLTMPTPRGFFGQDKAKLIMKTYRAMHFDDRSRWLHCYTIRVMEAYQKHLIERGETPATFLETLKAFIETHKDEQESPEVHGGALSLRAVQVPRFTDSQLSALFETRHSTRMFREGTIPKQHLLLAAQMAHSGPAACNRHPCRVHYINKGPLMKRALEIQGGNTGFESEIAHVAVVTCDLSSFLDLTERNQPWVEGGLFAMSLVLAFHAMGYGTCCLNWAATIEQDKAIRATGVVEDRHCVIMLIGLGLLRDDYVAAVSTRAPEDQLATFHD